MVYFLRFSSHLQCVLSATALGFVFYFSVTLKHTVGPSHLSLSLSCVETQSCTAPSNLFLLSVISRFSLIVLPAGVRKEIVKQLAGKGREQATMQLDLEVRPLKLWPCWVTSGHLDKGALHGCATSTKRCRLRSGSWKGVRKTTQTTGLKLTSLSFWTIQTSWNCSTST